MFFEILRRFAGPLRDFFDARQCKVAFRAEKSTASSGPMIVIDRETRDAALADRFSFCPTDRAASFLFLELFFVPLDGCAGIVLEIVAAIERFHPAGMSAPKFFCMFREVRT